MKNEIKILCPDRKCGRCRRMIARAEEVAKLTDQDEFGNYGIWMTPGLVVNGKVLSQGKIPVKVTLKHWLKQEMNE